MLRISLTDCACFLSKRGVAAWILFSPCCLDGRLPRSHCVDTRPSRTYQRGADVNAKPAEVERASEAHGFLLKTLIKKQHNLGERQQWSMRITMAAPTLSKAPPQHFIQQLIHQRPPRVIVKESR
ncbi:unnamed protein product [Nezara viridula]|uniref:Uncharacterized protein n=1 Tax=Nezara viridula TaxID=85310 RepID=A0A9P0MVM4_NEZVI|nr:unnamed protein product [Nezara viridula]